ncbi:MAG TPA: hypothetical protein DDZ51_26515 [Planctomycetaceae bacterium]|nr:hypothetical protein [Planctomycetaceae bacterium]
MKQSWIEALLAVVALAGLLVVGTAATEGVSTAQRVMTDLAMPIGLLWLMAFGAAVQQFRFGNRQAGFGLAAAFLAIWILFSSFFADSLIGAVEYPLTSISPIADDAPEFQLVILLGGAAGRNHAGHPELGGAGERIAMAAKLWHAQKTERIICTGTEKPRSQPIFDRGDGSGRSSDFTADDPAELGREILMSLGVPGDRIFRCGGQNTISEMQNLAAYLPSLTANSADPRPIGLITSAFHLPRAIRLAKTQKLDFVPIPAGSSAGVRNTRGIGILVPTAGAGESVARAAKEMLARVIGR